MTYYISKSFGNVQRHLYTKQCRIQLTLGLSVTHIIHHTLCLKNLISNDKYIQYKNRHVNRSTTT